MKKMAILVSAEGTKRFKPKNITIAEVYKKFNIDDNHTIIIHGDELEDDYIVQIGDVLVLSPNPYYLTNKGCFRFSRGEKGRKEMESIFGKGGE